MKLSILIPTHNRPKLFTRCLLSILNQIPDNGIEIIVNNDSKDIEEIIDRRVKYFYQKFNNLGQIYKFLLEQASGEFVFYLEDDDYLFPNFFKIRLDADLIAGNYIPADAHEIAKIYKLHQDSYFTDLEYIKKLKTEYLQLSQYIFKKELIRDFQFPDDNNVYNDLNLVLYALNKTNNIKTINDVLFYQTTHGLDNLSFEHTVSSVNITRSYKFLEDYPTYQGLLDINYETV